VLEIFWFVMWAVVLSAPAAWILLCPPAQFDPRHSAVHVREQMRVAGAHDRDATR
jgi:hypothetical protein